MKPKFQQLADLVITPVLKSLDLYSDVALNLVLGTASQETGMEYLAQWPATTGGGLGIYQIQLDTHNDLFDNFLKYRSDLYARVKAYGNPMMSPSDQLIGNLFYATAICRLVYYRAPEELPATSDPMLLGNYWKSYYNTSLGAGTAAEFAASFAVNIGPPIITATA